VIKQALPFADIGLLLWTLVALLFLTGLEHGCISFAGAMAAA